MRVTGTALDCSHSRSRPTSAIQPIDAAIGCPSWARRHAKVESSVAPHPVASPGGARSTFRGRRTRSPVRSDAPLYRGLLRNYLQRVSVQGRTLADLVALFEGRRLVALTGAGCSTESGIPDYRGAGTRMRARNPIQGPTFAKSESTRRRYWARAAIGWERLSEAKPNASHVALAQLETKGPLVGVITQNVDRLHHEAGSANVVELHGALAEVRCLACGTVETRRSVQVRMRNQNPDHFVRTGEMNPDGDADLEADASFVAPACLACGGALKPNVVFFGDSVPRPTVDAAFAMLASAEALLIAGTSLAVFSGYRFLRAARERGMPVGLVNLGESRGSDVADVWIEASVGTVLPDLGRSLRYERAPPADPRHDPI